MSEAAPGWLVAEVAEGIQRLLLLRLEGCPSVDAVEAVALAWADAVWVRAGRWTQAQDAPRLRQAFRSLAAHARRWPAPVEIWDHLPPRQEPRALEPPPPTPEQRARIRALLQQARQRLVR